jgi:hypothetical protein
MDAFYIHHAAANFFLVSRAFGMSSHIEHARYSSEFRGGHPRVVQGCNNTCGVCAQNFSQFPGPNTMAIQNNQIRTYDTSQTYL